MNSSISLVVFITILFVIQKRIDALSCYTCSRGSDGCGPSFDTRGSGIAVITNTNVTSCTKVVVSSNTNAITRGFLYTTCNEGSNTTESITSYQYCCVTDLCNESSTRKGGLMLAVIPILFTLLHFK